MQKWIVLLLILSFQCSWASPTDSTNLRFESLKELILTAKVSSVEDTLPLLSKQYPGFMRFYTLMYASDSLHETTFEKPRAIVFGQDARFVLTFNGDSHLRSGNSFETMEFSEDSQSFIFREITFKTETYDPKDPLRLKPHEIDFENSNLIISKPNPFKCLQCHGPGASPLWATTGLWPGAYGSVANNLYLNFSAAERRAVDLPLWEQAQSPISQGSPMFLRAGVRDVEAGGIVLYLNSKSTNDRYKWLPPQVSDEGFLRFAAGEKLDSIDLTEKYRQERVTANVGSDWPSKPNRFFQRKLMELNNRRMIADLKKTKVKPLEYAGGNWASLEDSALQKDGIQSLDKMALRILSAIRDIKVPKASKMEVVAALERNLRDEMDNQMMKVATHEYNFGEHAFEFHPVNVRLNLGWLGNPVNFYPAFLKLKTVAEVDRIAMTTETGNIVMITALQVLLRQRGFDLARYNMNLNHKGLDFYSGGLAGIAEYLGIPTFSEQ